MTLNKLLAVLSPLAVLTASCGPAASGENAGDRPFTVRAIGRFDHPWAIAIDAPTGIALVTEQPGKLVLRLPDGRTAPVPGTPRVDYGGQGGLGDVIFAPQGGTAGPTLDGRVIYLSWAEAGAGDKRGAAVGRGKLACTGPLSCRIDTLSVIWRQVPKVSGRGHYSHRLAFSPDGRFLFVSSGERQKFTPAQALDTNLGKIVRLLPDGTAAPGNPFADRPAPANQIWSYGHRNVLGLAFDAAGQLWGLEHGPAGGDELNRIEPGKNYGWPLVSGGDNYDGPPIPRHPTRPDLAAPALEWNPVIAPGDMMIYSGTRFLAWRGQMLIAGLKTQAMIRVSLHGTTAREEARYPFPNRLRDIIEAPDGAIWLLEDGPDARLLRLTPAAN
ncbi:PQQ-dependent sugar dehydrogenase [Novosphingobium colocasiae]|uniref:Dehydrogenase n=1 Tax=Novosphingobium colocasiae TaxID=1256513 RepID=A0A918UF43_9SPHN|nr:PQQ-dependent sugar dehydrogenase [Novosphingobium colocasiae]GGY98611.1 dehydrogenase [Novosphingobium colocasiae]